MKFIPHRHCVLLLALLAPLVGQAQTSLWIANGNLATIVDWNDPANWSAGVVPAGSGAAAVITQATPASRNFNGPYVNNPNYPVEAVVGGALPVLTGALTLGQLRFDVVRADSPRLSAVYIGSPGGGTPGFLLLDGAGLGAGSVGGTPIEVNVTSGSSLTFANRGSLSSGETNFLNVYLGESTAAATNPARLTFRDDTAIATFSRRITVFGRGPAALLFMDRAHAGNANVLLSADSTVEFHNTASADNARFDLGARSLLLFDGNTTAATSRINFTGGGANASIVRFAGNSTAAQANITNANYQYGAVEFAEQASGGSASVNALRLDLSGAATSGGVTGRTRATTATLAPTSVIASDARTIALKQVQVVDLLLGSNTLEVASGWVNNIRDSGGAYLSAAGENLVGGSLLINGTTNSYFTMYGPTYNPADPAHPSFNVISGATTVRQGNLMLYGNRLTNVTVEAGGKFSSAGGFVDGVLLNQGSVSPQTSILKVNGNFVQTTSGTYAPYFAYTPGESTTFGLDITGTATLAGKFSVSTHPNMFARWAPGVVELQLLSAGSIVGKFDSFDASLNPARIRLTPTYNPNNIKVRFEMLPFTALGATPGAQAFGAYLDRVYRYTGSLFPNNYNWIGDSLTFATDPVKVAQAMANFAPDRYGAVLDHGFATALARRAALDRAAGGNTVVAIPRRSAVFAEGGRRRLDYEAVDGLPAAETSTTSWLAGGRWEKGRWTAGAYVAREKTDVRLDETGSSAAIDSTEPGIFGRLNFGDSFVHASVGVSRDRYELSRVVNYVFNNTTATRTAAPDGQRTDWGVTAGHTFRRQGWSLTPFAGAVFSRWRMDDFMEGSSLAYPNDRLVISGWSRDSRRVRAGVELTADAWNGRVQPHLTATWWHEFEEDRSIPVHFVGEPTGYRAPGRPADRNTVQAALGIDVRLSQHASLQLQVALQHGDFSRASSDFTAGFRWEF